MEHYIYLISNAIFFSFIQYFTLCNVFHINYVNINMKPLLITFFVAILCYSLFIERRETPIHIDDINYSIQAESFDTLHVSDPSFLFSENIRDYLIDVAE